MRPRTQYFTAATLDGFIADPFDAIDWLTAPDDPTDTTYADFIRDVGAIAMGSHTYEWICRHLATSGEPWPYAQPTWVFSTRQLDPVAEARITMVQGDVRPVHATMLAQGGNIWIAGGGDLAGQFYDAGLLDDCFIQYSMTTLGAGKPLLPRRIVNGFRLESVRAIGTSMIAVRLRHAGPRPSLA